MKLSDIAQIRLNKQLLHDHTFKTPKEVVQWMGAMQAQNHDMAKWAVGVRLAGVNDADIEKALEDGTLVRTHSPRPTWHLIAGEDIRWILKLSEPGIKRSITNKCRKLGLNEKTFDRSNEIIQKVLSGGNHLTRTELADEIARSGIDLSKYSMGYIIYYAELTGIMCNGTRKGKEITYALLDEKIPYVKPLYREEALATLAMRYFNSHSPATLDDFVWWSGLSKGNARLALSAIQKKLNSLNVEGQTFWFSGDLPTTPVKDTLFLLPAFDELLVSYKERGPSLHPNFTKKVITPNGLFKPIIAVNGEVIGTWDRTLKKDHVLIKPNYFSAANKLSKSDLLNASKPFGKFLGLESKIV